MKSKSEEDMNINTVFNDVINYVEENIYNEINYEELAKMMGVSVFHFQRLFSFIAEIPIGEYIRCRRMTLEGFDIQKSNEKIIDIALKYRYESHSSFSSSFQLFHGKAKGRWIVVLQLRIYYWRPRLWGLELFGLLLLTMKVSAIFKDCLKLKCMSNPYFFVRFYICFLMALS